MSEHSDLGRPGVWAGAPGVPPAFPTTPHPSRFTAQGPSRPPAAPGPGARRPTKWGRMWPNDAFPFAPGRSGTWPHIVKNHPRHLSPPLKRKIAIMTHITHLEGAWHAHPRRVSHDHSDGDARGSQPGRKGRARRQGSRECGQRVRRVRGGGAPRRSPRLERGQLGRRSRTGGALALGPWAWEGSAQSRSHRAPSLAIKPRIGRVHPCRRTGPAVLQGGAREASSSLHPLRDRGAKPGATPW